MDHAKVTSLISSGFPTCFCFISYAICHCYPFVCTSSRGLDCGGWGQLISKPLEWISFVSSLSLSNVWTAFVKGFKAEPRPRDRLILSTMLPQSFWQPNYKNVFSPYLIISMHHPCQPSLSELHGSTESFVHAIISSLFNLFTSIAVLCYKCLCSSFSSTSHP